MSIKINIGSLNDGEHNMEFISSPGELGLDRKLIDGNITIEAAFFKAANQLDLRATATGKFNLECDRCLDEFAMPFETKFEIVFVQQHEREEKIDEDNVKSYSRNMTTVDITNDIKEYILLSVPMKKAPVQNDDGTCTLCGRGKDYWKQYIKEEENL